MESESGPILQVPEMCWVVVTLRFNQKSNVSSDTRSAGWGSSICLTMGL